MELILTFSCNTNNNRGK